MILHIPNEGQHRLVSVGVYPGAADLLVIHMGKTIFVEVKEPIKGLQSENQRKFEKHCQNTGIDYFLVYSLEDFKKIILNLPA